MKLKEEAQIKQEKDYEAQQKEIERLTAWIEKWKKHTDKSCGNPFETNGDRAHGKNRETAAV